MLPGHAAPLVICAGPCISTDTACSSSLVASHLAHKGLVMEECHAALAAGSNVMLLENTTAAICQLQVRHGRVYPRHASDHSHQHHVHY